MAISTRCVPSPVMRPAHSPSTKARPSSPRPSSVKNSMAESMSSTTMPTLSMRLTVTLSPWRLTFAFCRAAGAAQRAGGVGKQRAVRRHVRQAVEELPSRHDGDGGGDAKNKRQYRQFLGNRITGLRDPNPHVDERDG